MANLIFQVHPGRETPNQEAWNVFTAIQLASIKLCDGYVKKYKMVSNTRSKLRRGNTIIRKKIPEGHRRHTWELLCKFIFKYKGSRA
jgi:hypothetical protein